MDFLLTVGLAPAALLTPKPLWGWVGRSSVGWTATLGRLVRGRTDSRPQRADWDPCLLPDIRRRLNALTKELESLEVDPLVFANAFHLRAAQSAQRILLADAARLTDLAGVNREIELEYDIAPSPTPMREELEF